MLLKGDGAIRTPLKRVWDFLMDPNQVGQGVPGVEKIEMFEPDKMIEAVHDASPKGPARLLCSGIGNELHGRGRGNDETGAF